MSKVDAQRAMREARYAARRSAATPTPAAVDPSVPKRARAVKAGKAAKAALDPADARCGHTSMNGRECTREAGHSEKSHRYS